jgi:hypothetical protein
MKTNLMLVSVFLILCCQTTYAEAGKSIATLKSASGKIWIQDLKGKHPGKAGDLLYSGDHLIADENSKAQLTLGDHDVALLLKQQSDIKIENTQEQNWLIHLAHGSLLSSIKNPMKKADHFKVKVRGVAMGVRGAVFYVKDSPNQPLYFCDCRGVVTVEMNSSVKTAKTSAHEFTSKHHDFPTLIADGKADINLAMTAAPKGLDPDHNDEEVSSLDALLADQK